MGVLKLCHQSGLAPEARRELFGCAHVAWQNFDGNEAFHGWLVGFVNSRHATFPQWRDDLERAESLSGEIFHSRLPSLYLTVWRKGKE